MNPSSTRDEVSIDRAKQSRWQCSRRHHRLLKRERPDPAESYEQRARLALNQAQGRRDCRREGCGYVGSHYSTQIQNDGVSATYPLAAVMAWVVSVISCNGISRWVISQ